MTLIVGAICTDGVVLGADGAATYVATMGQRTARQPTKKLGIIDNQVVIGVSGSVGLGQRLAGEVHKLWSEGTLIGKQPYEAMTIVRAKLWSHIGVEYKVAEEAQKAIGQQLAVGSILSTSVVAMPLNDQPCLFQFDHQGAPDQATDDLPFVAIGSGQAIADPFLAFLRRIFWSDTSIGLADGVFAVLWTLKHAIDTHPGGVADPIQIVTLSKPDNCWRARLLDEQEWREHHEHITSMEGRLREYRDDLRQEAGAPDIPRPPGGPTPSP